MNERRVIPLGWYSQDVCDRSHGRCFHKDPMWRAQRSLILETWWRRWCSVEPDAWDWGANVTTAGATGAAETVDSGDVPGLGK